jgi:hypothetical protein
MKQAPGPANPPDKTQTSEPPADSSMEDKVISYVKTLPNAEDFADAHAWFWYRAGLLLAYTGWERFLVGA